MGRIMSMDGDGFKVEYEWRSAATGDL